MLLELGDECVIKNDNLDYSCRVEFKTKGFFSGEYNAIHGKVKHGHKDVGEVAGKWSDRFSIKRGKVCLCVRRMLLQFGEPHLSYSMARRERPSLIPLQVL